MSVFQNYTFSSPMTPFTLSRTGFSSISAVFSSAFNIRRPVAYMPIAARLAADQIHHPSFQVCSLSLYPVASIPIVRTVDAMREMIMWPLNPMLSMNMIAVFVEELKRQVKIWLR
ncbi:hypothetical protein HBI79_119120 [Parastagonospora nodorum]|nr:hypothetical protein HBI79_119120 [Parastagonospora nodorum]KAH5341396.1 hypothetical protein HBI48_233170 [Parastagonospora nodorum]